MIFIDKTLSCRDCAAEFIFSAMEQQQCASLGFRMEPERCPACRTERKAVESRSGVLPRSRRGLDRVGIHGAVCSACGRETRVPFLPKGDRPVYCGECFDRRRG
jgi:CxxC-x17-CxxC domain-containing protein